MRLRIPLSPGRENFLKEPNSFAGQEAKWNISGGDLHNHLKIINIICKWWALPKQVMGRV